MYLGISKPLGPAFMAFAALDRPWTALELDSVAVNWLNASFFFQPSCHTAHTHALQDFDKELTAVT